MNWKKYIWLIVLLAGVTTAVRAQYINIVCTGDTGVAYKVDGNEGSTFNWNVEGGNIVGSYGDSIKVNWGDMEGEFEVRVQEFSKYGCPAIPKSGLVLVSAPDIDLGTDIELCFGEYIEIDPIGTFYSYKWQDNTTNTSYIASQQAYVKLEVTDEYGCDRADSLFVTVHPLPVVNLGPDTSLCGIEELYLDGGNDGILFNWSTGETYNEILVYEGEKTIWVEVIDEYSCVAYDTIRINSCSPEDRFKDMPTAFTPNGDGKNDVWRIPEIEPFPATVVEIYDRWGNIIFRSDPGYSEPWDGIAQNGREMPMDSYYFVIDLGDGESEPIVGTVTLIK